MLRAFSGHCPVFRRAEKRRRSLTLSAGSSLIRVSLVTTRSSGELRSITVELCCASEVLAPSDCTNAGGADGVRGFKGTLGRRFFGDLGLGGPGWWQERRTRRPGRWRFYRWWQERPGKSGTSLDADAGGVRFATWLLCRWLTGASWWDERPRFFGRGWW